MQTSFTNFADLASHIAAARENEDLTQTYEGAFIEHSEMATPHHGTHECDEEIKSDTHQEDNEAACAGAVALDRGLQDNACRGPQHHDAHISGHKYQDGRIWQDGTW